MNKQVVEVKDVLLGQGLPKIIAPITGTSDREVLDQVKEIEVSQAQIIEWRMDYYEDIGDFSAVASLAKQMQTQVSKPLLLTFRTLKEGGVRDFSSDNYLQLIQFIIQNHLGDLVDVEFFIDENWREKLVALAKAEQVPIVMSSHDFKQTPSVSTMVSRLQAMADVGADICKLAVMPSDPDDVLNLLRATHQANQLIDRPLITMAMGELGKISRISGEVFGSSATFASVGDTSAPGQLSVDQVGQIQSDLRLNFEQNA